MFIEVQAVDEAGCGVYFDYETEQSFDGYISDIRYDEYREGDWIERTVRFTVWERVADGQDEQTCDDCGAQQSLPFFRDSGSDSEGASRAAVEFHNRR